MKSDDNASIVSLFDSVCVSYGDLDAIVLPSSAICYLELQEYSKDVARQLLHRFRPSYVLVDCLGHAAAEAVALLACMRIGIEFVPVSGQDQHAGGRLNVVVDELCRSKPSTFDNGNVVALVCCEDDQDPMLGVFAEAGVHQVLFMDKTGNLRERLNVSDTLPLEIMPPNDNLYVLFTSGTSSNAPKAVIGSHQSTLRRLKWFRDTFEPSRRVGRRTRLTFVDSITEIFQSLLFPPSVLVAVDPDKLQAEGVGALLDQNCTQLTLLPSQLSQILMLPPERLGTSLERLFISGEPCPASLLAKFRDLLPKTTLVNLYGQTETTGDVLYAILTDMPDEVAVVDHVVAVGTPIPPNLVMATSDGELIAKGNISNGYLNSSEKFDEFATGDVGFRQGANERDHVWYVQGRKDDMSKVNGIMTSPSEVEAVFCKVFSVDTVAATILDGQVYVLVDKDVPSFSRELMKEKGLPWNLIPKGFMLCADIPRQTIGAGKIDRRRVKEIVQDALKGKMESAHATACADFEVILAAVLNISVSQIDQTVSFVELGGDSASAVTFLYHLRLNKLSIGDIVATDLLQAGSISDLKKAILEDDARTFKRQRTEQRQQVQFKPKAVHRHSEFHVAVPFAACVDAAPLVHRESIYAACQGGVVQRANFRGKIEHSHHFLGWMVQADLLVVDEGEAMIVCAYKRRDQGMVAKLSLDLQSIKWKLELDGFPIKAAPVIKDGSLWICSGKHFCSISIATGKTDRAVVELPLATAVPGTVQGNLLVFPSSDYDTGLTLWTCRNGGLMSVKIAGELGPVFKDVQKMEDAMIISDSYGSIYRISLANTEGVDQIEQLYLSNKPLTSPCVLVDLSVVVGSYNSIVYCFDRTDWKTRKWEFDAQTAIFCTPLAMSDGSVVVCTTAGGVVRLSSADGQLIWKGMIPGEIWSNPVEVASDSIAFGARDSQLHIVTMRMS